MTRPETEERASTAKQIARASQETKYTMDDFAVCYKVLTGLDPEDIVDENGAKLQGHPELLRVHIGGTSDALIRHANELASRIDARIDEIIEEDTELVLSYVNGETNYCPDHSDLMSVLHQYGIVFRKGPRPKTWREMTYGGDGFEKFFDRDALGSKVTSYLKRIERDMDKRDNVKQFQFVRFAGQPHVFVLWTNARGVRFIVYARADWAPVQPVSFVA